mgnify:CR=1 FL=1
MPTGNEKPNRSSRVKGSLYGLFIGDALSMPVHWYYNRARMFRDYGLVTDYQSPKNPHPDSILWRSSYSPVNDKGEILHDQAAYWGRRGIHYHQFLRAGENTLNLSICRLLIDSLNRNGTYNRADFIDRYVQFMLTPSSHKDTYVEEYHRHWFTNYARGVPPEDCGVPEKHISGLIGLVPILLAYANAPEAGREAALTHLSLTHLGPRMVAAAEVLMDILLPVIQGNPLDSVLEEMIDRRHRGLLGHPIRKWLTKTDDHVLGRIIGNACYVEDSIPATVYLALKYHNNFRRGLIANTNLGGENAGRGAVLGAMLGAANGFEAIPAPWVSGLKHPPQMVTPVKES